MVKKNSSPKPDSGPLVMPTPARDPNRVLRIQALILFGSVAFVGLVWMAWSIGQDRGWGDPQRAVRTKMDKAQQAFVERRLDKAAALYRQVTERYPEDPMATQALTSLAAAYEEMDQPEQAGKAYEDLLAKLAQDPTKADLRAYTELQVAKLRQERGRPEEALKGFEAVRSRYPKTDWAGEALSGIGRVHQQQGRYKDAIASFEAVIKELPHGFLAAEAQGAIGDCLEAQGELAKALAAQQKVLRDYPSAVWDQAKARISALEARLAAQPAKANKGQARKRSGA